MKRELLSQPIPARVLLSRILDGFGLGAAFSRHNIVNLWPTIVNKTVARHAKAVRVSGATLYVIVDSSVWMNEMAALKKILLAKINDCLAPDAAPISDIRFQQRSWASNEDTKTDIPLERKATQKEVQIAERFLEPIKDEDLRCILQRLWEKDLRLKQGRSNEA